MAGYKWCTTNIIHLVRPRSVLKWPTQLTFEWSNFEYFSMTYQGQCDQPSCLKLCLVSWQTQRCTCFPSAQLHVSVLARLKKLFFNELNEKSYWNLSGSVTAQNRKLAESLRIHKLEWISPWLCSERYCRESLDHWQQFSRRLFWLVSLLVFSATF